MLSVWNMKVSKDREVLDYVEVEKKKVNALKWGLWTKLDISLCTDQLKTTVIAISTDISMLIRYTIAFQAFIMLIL